ncbi:MAG: chorismate synthase [bacterium]|nr:chorismate synthase [bacterium]
MLRFLTCGESHGKMMAAILEGLPNDLTILEEDINVELKRRQLGHGRGERSKSIEKDKVNIISGVRWGKTTGAPIGLLVENIDWKNRKKEMSIYPEDADENDVITRPRPGHADLVGMLKYGIHDAKPILERASARNTAMLVAVGAICKNFLKELDVDIIAYVRAIGNVDAGVFERNLLDKNKIEDSPVRCPSKKFSEKMIKHIDEAKNNGDTLGGKVCIKITGVIPGLGSHIQYDRRLDAGLSQIMMGIQSVKNVIIGQDNVYEIYGTDAHDAIYYSDKKGYYHKTNHAGGIEGGMSNGEDINITILLKPIPTLFSPLESIDVLTKEKVKAEVVRSDVSVASSAVVVAEAMAAIKLTEFYLAKFGSDSMKELKSNLKNYKKSLK